MIKKDTKVAILGAGAMGCLFGGLLAEKGLDVVLIDVWKDHVNEINSKGLKMMGHGGDRIVKVKATTEPQKLSKVDAIIVMCKATALKKSKSQRKKEKKLSRGQKQREKRRQQKAAAEAEAKEAEAALANKKSKKVKKIVAKNAETPQVKKDATKLALEGKKNKTAKEKLLLQKLNVLAGDAAALNKMTKISEKKDVAKKKQPMATAKAAKNAKSDKKAIKEQEQKRKLQQEFAEIGAPTGDHIPRKKRKAMLEEARKSKKMKMASIEDFEANRFASYN